jgi:hypothetical protein
MIDENPNDINHLYDTEIWDLVEPLSDESWPEEDDKFMDETAYGIDEDYDHYQTEPLPLEIDIEMPF